MVAYIDSFEFENALLALRPGKDGSENAELAWKYSYGVPECPSLIYYNGLVTMVADGGLVTCLDASTGEVRYNGKLEAGGPYYASPVYGDGKIYSCSARGVVTVFEAGDELNIFAHNDLKERIMATPALADGVIYIRTVKGLYAFGYAN
jgi:outer membrane protein assembly factor BamB